MADNKNNNNIGTLNNEGSNGGSHSNYSLKTDNKNFPPPPVSTLSGNTSDNKNK